MKCACWIAYLLCLAPLPPLAAGPAATQPVSVTLHAHDMPSRALLDELSRQAGAPFPISPPDLLDKSPLPPLTLDLDHQPFWVAMEQISRKTGLEPVLTPDDPYP